MSVSGKESSEQSQETLKYDSLVYHMLHMTAEDHMHDNNDDDDDYR